MIEYLGEELGNSLIEVHVNRRNRHSHSIHQSNVRLAMGAVGLPTVASLLVSSSTNDARQRCRLCLSERTRQKSGHTLCELPCFLLPRSPKGFL